MTITNGYCTLIEAKQRLFENRTYTASTISFAITTNIISDTAYGLDYVVDDVLLISGSASNNGYATVTAVGSKPASITVNKTLATEAAGASVTIAYAYSKQAAVSPVNDSLIEAMIEAASRWIDWQTGRTWFGATETRHYVVGEDTDDLVLYLDKPLLSVTTLTNGDGQALTATTHYLLEPRKGAPYYQIRLVEASGKYWDYSQQRFEDTITVAGSWGYAAAVTPNVKEACLLLVNRLWKRKDAVFGVAGTTSLGTVVERIPSDPDVMALLPKRTPWNVSY